MHIDYISTAMEPVDFKRLFAGQTTMPGQQVQKFNNLVIKGFAHNSIDVRAITNRPVSRQQPRIMKAATNTSASHLTFFYTSILNFPIIKNIWTFFLTFFHVFIDCRDPECAVVIDLLNVSCSFAASLAARINKRICIGIVTDLPVFLSASSTPLFKRFYQKSFDNCSGFVFLTEYMNQDFNKDKKPYIVMEGLCDYQVNLPKKESISSPRKCVYAGYLVKKYGMNILVEGFLKASIPHAELHFFGYGPYVEELETIAKNNKQIVYHGTVFNDQVLEAEREACLLINPRPSDQEFTKYSFPSKNIEYMSSGTPILTTLLPGMPKEYLPYIFSIEEETSAGVSNALKKVFALSDQELIQKGNDAMSFVFSQKNNKVQVQRIIKLIQDISLSISQ